MENLISRNHFLEERLRSLEKQISLDGKRIFSHASRGICSVTFDVEDESGRCVLQTNLPSPADQPAESCSCSLSPEGADNTFDQQRAPKHSQADGETLTAFVGAEDVCTDEVSAHGNTAADKTDTLAAAEDVSDQAKQDEVQTGAKHLESTEEMTARPETIVFEDQQESQTTKGSELETDDPSEKTGSAPEMATGDGTGQPVDAHVCDLDTDYKDVGGTSEMPQKVEEQVELNEEEEETRKEATEEENQRRSCSGEPEIDSRIPSNQSESFITLIKDRRAAKWKNRSLKYLKSSGQGSSTLSQRDRDLSKDNLRLASENLELRFQLEQANRDLPRLKNQVADLKEMCAALKKENAEVEKKLAHVGHSGKTAPELEKTIGLMKKVVERVQRENETLKKAKVAANQDKVSALEKANEKLKADMESVKCQSKAELSSKLESKTKGLEKIVMENERLHKEIKREMGAAERLKVMNTNLEVTNEKLEAELEENRQKLQAALSNPITEGTSSKTWNATVLTRMFENKIKVLENELSHKTSSLSELKLQLKDVIEHEARAQAQVQQLQDQVEMFTNFPATSKTTAVLSKDFQAIRLENTEPKNQDVKPEQKLNGFVEQQEESSELDSSKLKSLLRAAESEKRNLQTEVRRLKEELENFDPTFLEELEDLKYNYNVEVKKNILLEEQLKKVCDQFGVQADMPSVSIS